ncbi:MAG: hypothetical protein ACOVOQ_07360 [Flavobacterium sp.]|jgi:hypothetical protein
MDNRANNGGAREGAGRKPKSDELKMIENMDATKASIEVWVKLAEKVESGDVAAIKLWLEYRFGKPKQLIGLVTENETLEQVFKIGGVEIKL